MFSRRTPENRPLIVAHRGSSIHEPENTLAAFRRAIDDGADAIELDVRFSNDEQLVVFHDSRLDRKTNGSGLVRRASLAQLKKLTVAGTGVRSSGPGGIPTLAEVFDFCGGKMGLNVELKSDDRDLNIVDCCCALIREHRLVHSVLVSSFHHPFIKYLKKSYPGIPAGLLFHPLKHIGRSSANLAVRVGAEYMIFGGASLRKSVVENAHEKGKLVGEFTVNTARRFGRALRYDVDAVITDDPASMRLLHSSRQ